MNSRNKSQYKHFNKKRSHQLECGFSGFLCTYNNKLRERNCIREACGLLNEFADKLFGTVVHYITNIKKQNTLKKHLFVCCVMQL